MSTVITRIAEQLRVTGVRNIRDLGTAPDGNGGYVRKIAVFGTNEDPEVEEEEPRLVLWLHGAEPSDVALTTPAISY